MKKLDTRGVCHPHAVRRVPRGQNADHAAEGSHELVSVPWNEPVCSAKESCCTLLGIRSAQPPRCWRKDDKLANASYCDIKNAEKQESDENEKHQ